MMTINSKSNVFYSLFLIIILSNINSSFGKSIFSGERLRQECLQYLISTIEQEAEIKVEQVKDQVFSENGVTAEIKSNNKNLKGNTYIFIEFTLNNNILRREQVFVQIRLLKNVPVAADFIRSGKIIDNEDIIFEKKDVTYYNEGDILNPESIIGLETKTSIKKGTIITKSHIKPDIFVKRGNKVTLIVISGNVRIKSTGVALQDGEEGDLIRVKRDGANDVLIQGRISKDGTIIIE